MVSSLSLLLISFTVLAFEPLRNSQIWTVATSPSSALVKSTVSSWSLASPSRTFEYFYDIFIFARIFFLFGL